VNTDPVIVPIQVDLGQATAQLGALGQTIDNTRRAGAGPVLGMGGPPGAAATGGALDPQVLALRTLLRALTEVEQAIQRVTRGLDTFTARLTGALPGGAPDPAVALPPPGAPGAPAGGPGVRQALQTAPTTTTQLDQLVRQLVSGGFTALGLGVGIGAGISTVRHWMTTAQQFGSDLALATMVSGGGGAGRYAGIEQDIKRLGGRTFMRPGEITRGIETLGMAGWRGVTARDVTTLGDIGISATGHAGAGLAAGAEAERTFRSEPSIPLLLATIVQQGRKAGVLDDQQLEQLRSLTALYERTQGQYTRTPTELAGVASLSRWLTALPDRMGEGAAGARIAAGIEGMQQSGGPLGLTASLAAWRAQGHGAPGGMHEWVRFRLFGQDPTNVPAQARALREQYGPDVAALELEKLGIPLATAVKLTKRPLPEAKMRRLLSRDAAAGVGRSRERALRGTLGGTELQLREQEELMKSTHKLAETMAHAEQEVRKLMVEHPVAGLVGPPVAGYLGGKLGGMLSTGAGVLGAEGLLGLLGGTEALAGVATLALPVLIPAVLTGIAAYLGYEILKPTAAAGSTGLEPGAPPPPPGTGRVGGAAVGAMLGAAGPMGTPAAGAWIRSGHLVSRRSPALRFYEQGEHLPPGTLAALMGNESNVRGDWSDLLANPDAWTTQEGLPPSTARGPFQFTATTARKYGLLGHGYDYRNDPDRSAAAAARYAHDILRNAHGDPAVALAAHYYGGAGQESYARRLRAGMARYGGPVEAGADTDEKHVHVHVTVDPGFPGRVLTTQAPGVQVHGPAS
jgi:hypothetical protein